MWMMKQLMMWNSTFLYNFERDLSVLCPEVDRTINDGVRLHVGVVPEVGVLSGSYEFVDAAVPAHAGVGLNGRFAVLAGGQR